MAKHNIIEIMFFLYSYLAKVIMCYMFWDIDTPNGKVEFKMIHFMIATIFNISVFSILSSILNGLLLSTMFCVLIFCGRYFVWYHVKKSDIFEILQKANVHCKMHFNVPIDAQIPHLFYAASCICNHFMQLTLV